MSLDGRRLQQNIHEGVAQALAHCHGCTFSNTKTAKQPIKIDGFQTASIEFGTSSDGIEQNVCA